jgi:Ca2+-binding EF-hand superfamily protein
MKKILFAGAAIAAFIAIPASAQDGGERRGPMAGPLTRAGVQAMVQARFAMVDANRDGFVTREEAEARTAFRRGRMGERMAARRGRMEARGGREEARGEDRQERIQERMSTRFDKLDANHDGSISRSEFDGAMAARAEHRREGGPGMGNGRMGRGADREAMRDGAPRGGRMAHRGGGMGGMGGFGANMLERLDSDHDGRVSLAEAQARALAMFDRADANRDGTVTQDERRAARERFREARQDRRRG